MKKAFTLIELLVVIAIVAILAAILFPVFAQAKAAAKKTGCLMQQKQLAIASQQYFADNDGALFRHHEDWVLDDGTLLVNLPTQLDSCAGGGFGNSQAEKPWAIFFQPYMKNREMMFCPADNTTKSKNLATNLFDYNGSVETVGEECTVNPSSEHCRATQENFTMWSYMLNSIFTHRSCRFALEGALSDFATESLLSSLENPNIIMFSERNSEGLADPDSDFYAPAQDDYDSWAGEGAMVRWGTGSRPNEGWLKYDRHTGGANYVYADGHAKWMRWSRARLDQYPDHKVRYALNQPPQ